MIPIDPRLPTDGRGLVTRLYEVFRVIAIAHNKLSGGYMEGCDNRATSSPTSGSWAVGDFVKNSTPTELGTAGSKYVVHGWVCVTAGSPGTWLQQRFLTGN